MLTTDDGYTCFFVTDPSKELKPRIDICWSWFGSGEEVVTRHEVFPDSSVKLVFRFSSQHACRMVLIGPMTETSTIEIDQRSDYFGFRFVPDWAPRLTQLSIRELIDSSVDVEEVNGQSVEELGRYMYTLRSHEARQQVMEALISRLPHIEMDGLCRSILRQISRNHGKSRLTVMAQRAGAPLRHLERSFHREIGLSPKKISRLIRLRKVLTTLYHQKSRPLAELAADCGFTDQSHLIRDFKAMTGNLPGAKNLFEPKVLIGPRRTRFFHPFKP